MPKEHHVAFRAEIFFFLNILPEKALHNFSIRYIESEVLLRFKARAWYKEMLMRGGLVRPNPFFRFRCALAMLGFLFSAPAAVAECLAM